MGQLPETTIIDIAFLAQPNVDFSLANVLENLSIWSMLKANLAISLDNETTTNKIQGLTLYVITHIEGEIMRTKHRHEPVCVCAIGSYQCIAVFIEWLLYHIPWESLKLKDWLKCMFVKLFIRCNCKCKTSYENLLLDIGKALIWRDNDIKHSNNGILAMWDLPIHINIYIYIHFYTYFFYLYVLLLVILW